MATTTMMTKEEAEDIILRDQEYSVPTTSPAKSVDRNKLQPLLQRDKCQKNWWRLSG
ncbi:hypothetical protein T4D_6196 [Trichinella pseudospiralis]|uniref:Uncharacterized protein n=1 Tax=Trichinella pseudospiralis TaxID=6337 RepID=A0A0V1FDV0_TRIPS|nr:hypothetical protein T4D_6196 [Trichinella pseudospiralis]